MELSPRRRRALESICEAFAPGSVAIGVPDAIVEAASYNPRRDEHRRLELLLSAWSALPGWRRATNREDALRAWRDSRLAQRRLAYKVLRKAVLHHAYALPGQLRDSVGYPGPLRDVNGHAPAVATAVLDGEPDCDVCVVGSGAGGATAAGVLAEAGLDVVLLEAGPMPHFDGEEVPSYRRMYLEAAASATADQALDFLAGWCVGGGTTVNWTTSLRTPDDVREEWGAPFDGDEFSRSLDAVWQRLEVNDGHGGASARDLVLERGANALGWHVAAQPRNVVGCDQGRICGYCGLSCPIGAKRTSLTWLDGVGVRVVPERKAERVLVERGAAVGVAAGGLRVRSRAVVAACGAFHTPALLARSGLRNGSIGRNLRFHPTTILLGEFDEEIRAWEGSMQARYSDEHARLDGAYGLRYETPPMHPGLLGAILPWDGAAAFHAVAQRYPYLSPLFPLVRDRDGGRVDVGRDGEPRAHYWPSAYDMNHIRRGFEGAARILEAAGAKRIYSTHARGVTYNGSIDAFVRAADAAGWDPGRVLIGSAHVMGTARMGSSPATSACDPRGETWEVANLVVCDGSTFPTSSGVNPMITIEAIAHMNASALAARLA